MGLASKILHLPPFPKGWYVAALSGDVKTGAVKPLHFCGHELVIYRTQNGQAVVADAYCPHMGAHFGHGGKVVGENLECPFHGFCFDPTGKCTKTGYGTKPPPQARMGVWPVQEVNGLIMAWNDPEGSLPTWEIPSWEWEGWSSTRFAHWRLNAHPQEVAENSVDLGHFALVHGYESVKVFEEARTNGPVLNSKYGMARVANFIGKGKGGRKVHVEFTINQHGLGFALVEAYVVEYKMHSRHFVLSSPIDGKEMHLRIGVSVRQDFKPGNIHPILGMLPKALLMPLVLNGYFKGYCKDVSDDFKVWNHKVYVHPPALAQGDGPVILYRKWAEQFYTEPPTGRTRNVISTEVEADR
jgi:nitrite reductase/ring-hydroxylating ferredoxin subunit